MSSERSEQSFDLAAVAADNALLDALGAGEPATGDDELAGLLAAWRSELDADLPSGGDLTVDVTDDLIDDLPVDAPASERWARPRRVGRMTRFLTSVAAALLVFAGLAVAANHAGPDSPLWPLAQVMYPQQTDTRAAEHAIELARAAIAAGRADEARRRLDEATALVDRIRDPNVAQRLRDEIEQVRRALAAANSSGGPTPSSTGTPGNGTSPGQQPNPPGGATTTPNPGPGGGATSKAPGGILPPGLPLPTPKLPLPSLPLPSLPVPGLPLPSLPLPSLPLPTLPIHVPPIL